jgi:hypothetical protein
MLGSSAARNQGGTSMSDTAPPMTFTDDEISSFGTKLAAWADTLGQHERLILVELVQRAIVATPNDTAGFGGLPEPHFEPIGTLLGLTIQPPPPPPPPPDVRTS